MFMLVHFGLFMWKIMFMWKHFSTDYTSPRKQIMTFIVLLYVALEGLEREIDLKGRKQRFAEKRKGRKQR